MTEINIAMLALVGVCVWVVARTWWDIRRAEREQAFRADVLREIERERLMGCDRIVDRDGRSTYADWYYNPEHRARALEISEGSVSAYFKEHIN